MSRSVIIAFLILCFLPSCDFKDKAPDDGSERGGRVDELDPGARSMELKAFPSAEGFGKMAKVGRGERAIKVTNLNDAGAGSFRSAIDVTGARTVVFEVSGTIVLQSERLVKNSFNTIAGQTAPGQGIQLRINSTASLAAFTVGTRENTTAGIYFDGKGRGPGVGP